MDFRRLFDAIPGQFLVLDPAFVIVAVSEAYLAATMTTREQIVGRDVFDVFPDDPSDPTTTSVRNLRSSLERVRAHRVPDAMAVQRYAIRRPEHEGGGFEERYWSPRNAPVLDRAGQLICIIHRVEDVTDYVLVSHRATDQATDTVELRENSATMATEILARSAEVRQVNEELTAANQARTVFLSRLSHELRTPLSTILGFAELLAVRPLGRVPRKYVDTIVVSGQHLLKLVNDVLDILRLESGAMPLSLERVSLRSMTFEACELMRPMAAAHHVVLEHGTEDRFLFANADRERLQQVVLSLLSNAIKYNRPEGRVYIRAHRSAFDRERVVIVVDDTGPGIPPDALDIIFVPFERLDARDRGIEGMGLELTLARLLIEAMGGHISIQSEAGSGTDVSVELSASTDDLAARDAEL